MKRISIKFKWNDIWVGVYINPDDWTLYICPIPMICISIKLASTDPVKESILIQELQTGKIYSSAIEASFKTNENIFQIIRSCNNGIPTVNGRKFVWR